MLNVLRKNKGFSLVELMIVVAIIGILAAVAIPNFQRFQRKARQSEARTLLSGYYTATSAGRSEWGAYVGNFQSNGFSPDGNLTYRIDAAQGPQEGVLNNGAAVPGAGPATCITTMAGHGCASAMWTQKPVGIANVLPGPAAGPAAANAGNTFTASAGAFIGGGVADTWTIDQTKLLTNVGIGLD